MSKEMFQVQITPIEVLDRVKNELNADLIHEEIHDVGNNRYIVTLVFEKYFFRVKNRVALVVTSDNLQGITEVRVVSTASSEGLIFNFDWGASSNFVYSVRKILSAYLIE